LYRLTVAVLAGSIAGVTFAHEQATGIIAERMTR
jgi:hypothetical protein